MRYTPTVCRRGASDTALRLAGRNRRVDRQRLYGQGPVHGLLDCFRRCRHPTGTALLYPCSRRSPMAKTTLLGWSKSSFLAAVLCCGLAPAQTSLSVASKIVARANGFL